MLEFVESAPNYLVLLGYIEILPKIYGEVLIPQAVLDELQDSDAPVEVRAWVSTPPAWLRISSIVYPSNPLLDFLDRGERDAILTTEGGTYSAQ